MAVRFSAILLLLVVCGISRADEPAAPTGPIEIEPVKLDKPVDFNSDVLPILKKSCLSCHQGADAEAGLVLESPQQMLKGGDSGAAIDPKHPGDSLLLKVASRREKPFMPPKNNKANAPPLTPRELGILQLWIQEGAKGSAKRVLDAPQWQGTPAGWQPIYALAVSPDSQHVAVARANRIHLYHLPSQRLLATLADPNLDNGVADLDTVQSLAFSPDGSRLASGGYRSIHLWKRTQTERRFKVAPPASPVGGVTAVSPDQKLLASFAPNNTVRIVDLSSGQQIRELNLNSPAQREQQAAADYLAYTQRETALYTAGVNQTTAAVTDLTNKVNQSVAAQQAAAQDVTAKQTAAEAAKTALTAAEQNLADATKAATEADTLAKNAAAALAAAQAANPVIPDAVNQATTAKQAADQSLQQAQAKQQEATKQKTEAEQKKTAADQALVASTTAKQTADKSVQDLQQALQVQTQNLEQLKATVAKTTPLAQQAEARNQQAAAALAAAKSPGAMAFTHDGTTLLIGLPDGSVLLAPVKADGMVGQFRPHGQPIVAISVSDKNELLTIAADGEARAAPLEATWVLERVIQPADPESPPVDRVLALAFSPDSTLLASGGGIPSREGELLLWQVADGKLAREFKHAHSDTVGDVRFWRDGFRLGSAAADKFIKTFNTADGQLLRAFEGHTGHVLGMGWNQSGHTFASAGADKVVKIWQFHEGKQLKTIDGFDKPVNRVRFLGPREDFAAAWGKGRVQVIHENGTRGRAFDTGPQFVYALDTSPDGLVLAAGGQDGVLRVWESLTGKTLGIFPPP